MGCACSMDSIADERVRKKPPAKMAGAPKPE
jgi:hypothetical protein